MKRLYVIVFLVVALAVALAVGVSRHPGYVLIDYPHVFRYESGLWATLAALLLVALIVFVAWLVLGLLGSSGRVVNPWSGRNRDRRVRMAIEQGQMDLIEGRWASAHKHLRRAAEAERQPLLYYLGAARAANEQGHYEECDALLERALERQPQAELAIALTHAQLQTDRGDTDGALQTLQVMHERHPRNTQVLRQLQRLHQQRGDWSAVVRLLPDLRKDNVLPAPELAALERQAWGGKLTLAAYQEGQGPAGLAALQQAWQQLSSGQRHEAALVAAYAEQLRQLGANAEAEDVLRSSIKREYDSHLARLYGLIASDPVRQLQVAEGWLKAHPQDPGLLLTLGRLSLHAQLWGKARDYLESSLRLQRNPEACAELARLLAQLGDTDRSNKLFQEGLGLLDARLLSAPMPVAVRG